MSEHDAGGGGGEADRPRSAADGVLAGLDPMGTPRTPVWRVRWFQVLLGGLVALAVASYVLPPVFEIVYMTRPVLLPVLIGLALAYAFNRPVTWAAKRHRMPRVFSAAVILIWFFGGLALAFAWLTGPVVGQARQLVRDLPGYVEASTDAVGEYLEIPTGAKEAIDDAVHGDLGEAVGVVLPAAEAVGENLGLADAERDQSGTGAAGDASPAAEPEAGAVPMTARLAIEPDGGVVAEVPAAAEGSGDAPGLFGRLLDQLRTVELSTLSSTGLAVLDVGASTLISGIGLAGYLTVAGLVVCFCFFFATWKWPAFVAWWLPYLPASHRDEIVKVACQMDQSVSAFLRGRLIQAFLLAVVLCVGFTLVGTPGGLLLGITGGVLGLIPYFGAVIWPVAVVLSVMNGLAIEDGPSLWWAVLAPTIVYAVGQGLDAWVVEPLVQGKATNLDALTVLLVVLAGGSVAGLLGLLLAIPVAACIKILWREVVGPRIRAVARAS